MNRSSWPWLGFVLLVGIGLAAFAGASIAPVFGTQAGLVWTGWLLYVFALAFGANRLQVWLARPPVAPWKGTILGAVAFIPMFLGWFPASNWAMEAARTVRYERMPSPVWIIVLMFWGLLAPGGVLVDVFRKLKASRP